MEITPKEKAEQIYRQSGYFCTIGRGAKKSFSRQKAVDISMQIIKEVKENLEPLCISHLGTYKNPKIYFWDNVEKELLKKI
jgi:hypothetical protein